VDNHFYNLPVPVLYKYSRNRYFSLGSMDKGKSSLLILIVEIDSLVLPLLVTKTGLEDFSKVVNVVISSIALFCNSFSLMHRQNKLVVISSLSGSMSVIYPRGCATIGSEFVPVHHEISPAVCIGLKEAVQAQIDLKIDHLSIETGVKGGLSQAMSVAMALINRHSHGQSRVLVVQFDKDRNKNYNSMMNSIFRYQPLSNFKLLSVC
jgi:hypothetical protein